jgi:hypothetical protein
MRNFSIPRSLQWDGHLAQLGKARNAHRKLGQILLGWWLLERGGMRREDYIKMGLRTES